MRKILLLSLCFTLACVRSHAQTIIPYIFDTPEELAKYVRSKDFHADIAEWEAEADSAESAVEESITVLLNAKLRVEHDKSSAAVENLKSAYDRKITAEKYYEYVLHELELNKLMQNIRDLLTKAK